MSHKSDPNCPFCKIVSGEYPSKKVYEDSKVMCVLDINPAAQGHILIFPKNHYFIMPQIPPDEFSHLSKAALKISEIARQRMFAQKTKIFIANGGIAGQQVAHFLMHIIPEGIHSLHVEGKENPNPEIYDALKKNLRIMLQKNGKNSSETEHLFELEGMAAKVPKKSACKGHIELHAKSRDPEFFMYSNICSSASFDLLGAQGSNIIIDDSDAGIKAHIIPRFSDDGLNFLWTPKKLDEHTMSGIQSSIEFGTIGMTLDPVKTFRPVKIDQVKNIEQKDNFISNKLAQRR
ncbi:MAG: HIT domain-containing protein [Candidatus Woesearchaeota archaeon]|nr:HIT domain-containing protein [Candidatus Woesearchaeota archaeon]